MPNLLDPQKSNLNNTVSSESIPEENTPEQLLWKSVSKTCDSIMNWVLNSEWDIAINYSQETSELFLDKLNTLSDELSEAIELFKEIFNRDFGFIEAAATNIEYSSVEDMEVFNSIIPNLNTANIEAWVIFSWFNPDDNDDTTFYNILLEDLKSINDPELQAYVLWFIDTLSDYILNKEKYLEEINSNEAKKMIFNNNKVILNYKKILQKYFELLQKNIELVKSISEILHQNWKKNLTETDFYLANEFMNYIK